MICQKKICITLDSVLRIDKKNHPQVYLEECKYRAKKIQMSRFINIELKSDSEPSDSDSESEKIEVKVDNELEKSDSDSEKDILLMRFCLCLHFWRSNFLPSFVMVKNTQTF